MSNTFSTQLTQQRITDAGGREFRFRGDLYSQESTFPLVAHAVTLGFANRNQIKKNKKYQIVQLYRHRYMTVHCRTMRATFTVQ